MIALVGLQGLSARINAPPARNVQDRSGYRLVTGDDLRSDLNLGSSRPAHLGSEADRHGRAECFKSDGGSLNLRFRLMSVKVRTMTETAWPPKCRKSPSWPMNVSWAAHEFVEIHAGVSAC